MSFDGPRCTHVQPVDVPAGADGVALLAAAVSDVLAGRRSVALVPTYAPAEVASGIRTRVMTHAQRPVDAEQVLVCPTSGSTGRPSLVMLGASAITAAAAARDAALGGPSAWFVVLPAVTAASVIAVARAVLAETSATAWPGLAGAERFSPESLIAAGARALDSARSEGQPLRTSLVSRQLAALLDLPDGASTLARFDRILVGGGPVSGHLHSRARAAGVRVVTTYGQTETCGGCVYDGVPGADCEVTVDGRGEILVSGPCLASGYLDGVIPTIDGKVRTGDRGRWQNGRLEVLGRFDDVVTVGGANVDIAWVTAVVRDVPGVADAAVVAQPDPAGGQRLAAFVTGTVDPQVVRTAVATRLGGPAVPRVVVVAELPRLPGGKTDVRRLEGCES